MDYSFITIGISICWLCSSSLVLCSVSPIVDIKNGTLEGTVMRSRKGREFLAFRGIPYARPPLGNLRFEPPKPSDSWTGIRSAKKDGNVCIQRDMFSYNEEIVGSEDCLYLNVYTPQLRSYENDPWQTNYPVMIYIHGGGLIKGAGHSALHEPKFFLDHDVVLVTINYRLGPLGFLSTEDLVCPGNQGSKDQTQSIKWVNENIAAFSGDPNRVTLFGNSAGGVSVHFHMISPLSKGLFHRGISQSGTLFSPWALIRPGTAKNQAIKLGRLLDCPTDKPSSIVNCLKEKDAVDIIATDRSFQMNDFCLTIPFGMVVEAEHPNAFLAEEPILSLESGKLADIPWMTGITSREGLLKVSSIYGMTDETRDEFLDEKFKKLEPIRFHYEHVCPKELKPNRTQIFRKFDEDHESIKESTNRWGMIDVYSDAISTIGAETAVDGHSQAVSSPIYYYFFEYKGSASHGTVFGDNGKNYGVSHVDELQYLFPVGERSLVNSPLDKEDEKVVDLMTKLWINFADFGNPTPKITPTIPVIWERTKSKTLEYLHIKDSKNLRIAENLFDDKMKNVWQKFPEHNYIINADTLGIRRHYSTKSNVKAI